jgi:hypothetical protein
LVTRQLSPGPLGSHIENIYQGGFMRIGNKLCFLFLIYATSFAQEQIKQGVYSLGGSIYYSSVNQKDDYVSYDRSQYFIMPSISYFIADQCELSFNLTYIKTTSKMTFSPPSIYFPPSESKSANLGLGLGIKYYIPAGKVSPFIGISGGTSWSAYQDESFSPPTSYYAFTGGLEIFISSAAAIEPAIIYSHYRYIDQPSLSNIQVGVGFKYFIL